MLRYLSSEGSVASDDRGRLRSDVERNDQAEPATRFVGAPQAVARVAYRDLTRDHGVHRELAEVVADQTTDRDAAALGHDRAAHVGVGGADDAEGELVDRLRQRVVEEDGVVEADARRESLAAEIAGVIDADGRVVPVLQVGDGGAKIGGGTTVQLEEVVGRTRASDEDTVEAVAEVMGEGEQQTLAVEVDAIEVRAGAVDVDEGRGIENLETRVVEAERRRPGDESAR